MLSPALAELVIPNSLRLIWAMPSADKHLLEISI